MTQFFKWHHSKAQFIKLRGVPSTTGQASALCLSDLGFSRPWKSKGAVRPYSKEMQATPPLAKAVTNTGRRWGGDGAAHRSLGRSPMPSSLCEGTAVSWVQRRLGTRGPPLLLWRWAQGTHCCDRFFLRKHSKLAPTPKCTVIQAPRVNSRWCTQ